MNFQPKLLMLLAVGWGNTQAALGSTNFVSSNRILMIDPSSMPIAAGKITLTIGALQRVDGVYSGNYKVNVFPYFFKHEKGRLAIAVSDESLTGLNQGKVTEVIGTATTSGKTGKTRHIDATATPADTHRGKLKLSFQAGERKMTFEPAYHFVEQGTAAVLALRTDTNPASRIQHRFPKSPYVTVETTNN